MSEKKVSQNLAGELVAKKFVTIVALLKHFPVV
jgi:hypothetical protein